MARDRSNWGTRATSPAGADSIFRGRKQSCGDRSVLKEAGGDVDRRPSGPVLSGVSLLGPLSVPAEVSPLLNGRRAAAAGGNLRPVLALSRLSRRPASFLISTCRAWRSPSTSRLRKSPRRTASWTSSRASATSALASVSSPERWPVAAANSEALPAAVLSDAKRSSRSSRSRSSSCARKSCTSSVNAFNELFVPSPALPSLMPLMPLVSRVAAASLSGAKLSRPS
mmetsp:Transcript_113705/g.213020  ORF Transcript_113705/g.213020 Transcript_113705/m.213020 type:complete len:226 (-) Transcript_113705:641-1318(-)